MALLATLSKRFTVINVFSVHSCCIVAKVGWISVLCYFWLPFYKGNIFFYFPSCLVKIFSKDQPCQKHFSVLLMSSRPRVEVIVPYSTVTPSCWDTTTQPWWDSHALCLKSDGTSRPKEKLCPQYLSCLTTSRSLTDKLAFDVGLQEDSTGN